jgi:DNA mismatch endonuclease, patch repair protein
MRGAASFRNLQASSLRASHILARNKSSNTTCERVLRSELWKLGLRFRKNVNSLPGKPDIVFTRNRLVIFCDGDFWHGRDWKTRRKKLRKGSNASYWVTKIQQNIKRDQANLEQLEALGWTVLRLWETDILRAPSIAARQVLSTLHSASKDSVHTSKRTLGR